MIRAFKDKCRIRKGIEEKFKIFKGFHCVNTVHKYIDTFSYRIDCVLPRRSIQNLN